MVLDYSERRQVAKNRPKNRPVNLIVLVFAGIVLGIYSLGVVTGWFLYKKLKKNSACQTAPVAADAKQKPGDARQPANAQQKLGTAANKSGEPALTFYYTLPRGEKTALGSGLNPSTPNTPGSGNNPTQNPAATKQNTPQGVAAQQSVLPAKNADVPGKVPPASRPADKAGTKKAPDSANSAKPPAPDKSDATRKRYSVQVASCSTRKEAEAIKNSLDRSGLLSHIVESKVPGKGIWYRVRLGSGLDRETANKVAARAGRGAMVIPE
jgi:cell division protein FtsN